MEYTFKAELIHDLEVHKEFVRTYNRSNLFLSVVSLVYSGILIWFMTLFSHPSAVYRYLVIAAIALVLYLVTHPKKGDIQYQRMLQGNNDEPVHMVYTFCEDGIHCTIPSNGNKHFYRYDQFRKVIDSPRLILLVMKHRSCILVDKYWLQGGTSEELIAYLFRNCPNIRRKKARKTNLGKWSARIVTATLIIGVVFALANFPGMSLMDKLTGRLHNDMTYQEMAEELADVDILISPQAIDELETYDAEYYADTGEEFYADSNSTAKIFDLLYWEGCGFYNEETWEWTPSTSGVYWVELEVWDVEAIYTNFLTGLSAMDDDLDFTNIQEDYINADLGSGTGTVEISFDWKGQHYQLEAQYDYDWFDVNILYEVSNIIAAQGGIENLYLTYGDYAGLLLYYADAVQVRELERLTGLDFEKISRMLIDRLF